MATFSTRTAIGSRLDGVPADVADAARRGIANAVEAGARSPAVVHAVSTIAEDLMAGVV
jgi:hypothetical protein